jgi:hypothetical protein
VAAARVTVWNEHVSERREQAAARAYPLGLHATIAEGDRRGARGRAAGDRAARDVRPVLRPSRRPMSSSSSAPSAAVRCSAAAAASTAAPAGSSTSRPVTRPTRSTTSQACAGCSPTRSPGRTTRRRRRLPPTRGRAEGPPAVAEAHGDQRLGRPGVLPPRRVQASAHTSSHSSSTRSARMSRWCTAASTSSGLGISWRNGPHWPKARQLQVRRRTT